MIKENDSKNSCTCVFLPYFILLNQSCHKRSAQFWTEICSSSKQHNSGSSSIEGSTKETVNWKLISKIKNQIRICFLVTVIRPVWAVCSTASSRGWWVKLEAWPRSAATLSETNGEFCWRQGRPPPLPGVGVQRSWWWRSISQGGHFGFREWRKNKSLTSAIPTIATAVFFDNTL